MNTEHATPELFDAIAAAQGEIENASKNAANPHFKSKYADLAEILNTTRPVFAKHGLCLSQFPGFDGALARSEESRVGKECVCTGKSRGSRVNKKKKNNKQA